MIEIRIPQVGMGMTSGAIGKWLIEDGAQVGQGQPLYVLEADKVELEIEAPVSGRLKQLGAAGTEYAVGDVVALIE